MRSVMEKRSISSESRACDKKNKVSCRFVRIHQEVRENGKSRRGEAETFPTAAV